MNLIKDYKNFFFEINLFNSEQISEFQDVEFAVENSGGKVKLFLYFSDVFPKKLFDVLLNNTSNVVEGIEIKFVYQNFTNKENLINYFNFPQLAKIKSIEGGILTLNGPESIADEIYANIPKYLVISKQYGFPLADIMFVSSEQEVTAKQKADAYNFLLNKPERKYTPPAPGQKQYTRTPKESPLKKIKEIKEECTATIVGQIVSVEEKKTKTGKVIYTVSVTDYEDAITFIYFHEQDSEADNELLGNLKKGNWVEVNASYKKNKYSNDELQGTIRTVKSVPIPAQFIRTDDAEKSRIELLCHTKFTAFDGVCSAGEAIARSLAFKHPGIGFCDRGNAQGFPSIAMANKNQKIFYGSELNIISKKIPIVQNLENELSKRKIDNVSYVVFDLETTGLNNEYDEITEFGGVKITNGTIQKTENFDIFIKPKQRLRDFIVAKTHITNEMLEAQGVEFEEAAKKILDYIGNSVLIAHNGRSFDFRFLNKKLVKLGYPPLKNICIDSLEVSRSINPDMTRHNLGALCKANQIKYDADSAHRADFDADVLAQVWLLFINKMKSEGIETIEDINEKLQNYTLRRRQFASYINVYAKNQKGLKDLYKLISLASTEQLNGETPTIYYEQLNDFRENIIICSNPFEGEIWDAGLNDTDENLAKIMEKYDYIFVAPASSVMHEVVKQNITMENVKVTIKRIVDIAKANNKKVCAVSDAYYLDEWEKIAHRIFIYNKLVGGGMHRFYAKDNPEEIVPVRYYRNTQEMKNEFEFLGDEKLINEIVVENTHDFSSYIDGDIKILKKGLFTPKIPDVEIKFRELCYQNLKLIYGEKPNPLISERLDTELDMIISKEYAVIYWISHELIKKSNEDGYVVGSRGSVGSSLAAFFSGVSEVNPLPAHYICNHCKHHEFPEYLYDGFDLPTKICPVCGKKMRSDGHNIPFVTFLGTKGAEKVPDIDMNFSGEYQPKAHKFIHDWFGKDYAFKAGTILTIAEKTAYGMIKKYYEIAKPGVEPSGSLCTWLEQKLVDGKRTTGQHAGGMIVVPKEYDITDFCPYSYPPDDTSGWYTTHFDFHVIHDNVLKFDILGHDYPTILNEMEKLSGVSHNEINYNDPKVVSLFIENAALETLQISKEQLNGETLGTFAIPECSTEFTLQMIKDAKPRSFDDLIRISGLSHGTDVWIGNAKELIAKQNLKLSDVVCCREDMLLYFQSKGIDEALSFNVAESVRKGKGIKPELCEKLLANGVPDWYIESCQKIKYLFPKAHATAYMTASFVCCWYKIYYPLAFYSAYFTIKPEYFDIKTVLAGPEAIKEKIKDIKRRRSSGEAITKKEEDMIDDVYKISLECYARGIIFKNVDLAKSDAKKFIIEGNTLIIPFSKIDGLGETVARSIVEARKVSPFKNIEDFKARTKINKKTLLELTELGALDNMDENDQISLTNFFN